MLQRKSKSGALEPWSIGAAMFRMSHDHPRGQLPVAVRCRLGGQGEVLALLDTGARWSVIDEVVASELGDQLADTGITVPMGTRLGSFRGYLHRVDVALLADPSAGSDLKIEATVLVLPGWDGPVVLGFTGFLERVRFALDPDDERPTFYFGPRA